MPKSRLLFLILGCLALGALVFLDNKPASGPQSQPSASSQLHQPTSEDGSQDHTTPSETSMDKRAEAVSQLDNPLTSFDKAVLKDTVERPLFASSRRRPPPAEKKVVKRPIVKVAPKPEPPSYDLLGVVRQGNRAIALLRKKSDGTNFRVEVGDMIGGWRVAKLEPTSVLLERDDGTSQIVPLFSRIE